MYVYMYTSPLQNASYIQYIYIYVHIYIVLIIHTQMYKSINILSSKIIVLIFPF